MSKSEGYEYVVCKSTQSVQWGAFAGQIPFTFKTPTDRWCKPRESYLAVKLRAIYNDGTNQVPIKTIGTTCIPYFVKNPVSVMFTTGKVLVQDSLISNMNELSATNTLFKTIYDTKSMQETIESTCPIIPQAINEARNVYASKCQLMFDKANENTLCWSLPFPLFQSNEWIPPHVKVEIDLNVNNNWYKEILSCVGAFPAGGVVPLGADGRNTVANSIGLGVDDISLWLYYVKMPSIVGKIYEIHMKQYFSQIHTITSTNESFTLTLPNGGRNVTHLMACFLQRTRGSVLKRSSNDFSSGYLNGTDGEGTTGASPVASEVKITGDAVTNLKMIRFVLDKTYPNPDYSLNFDLPATPTNNTLYNTEDVSRAFYDFLNNADAKFDRSGNIVSIQQFINEPMFCFKVNTESTTYHETLQVYVTLGNNYAPSTSQLLVVALYNEDLRLTFGGDGQLINALLVS